MQVIYIGIVPIYSGSGSMGILGAVSDVEWDFWRAMAVHVTAIAEDLRRGVTTDSPESSKNMAIGVRMKRIIVIDRRRYRRWGTS